MMNKNHSINSPSSSLELFLSRIPRNRVFAFRYDIASATPATSNYESAHFLFGMPPQGKIELKCKLHMCKHHGPSNWSSWKKPRGCSAARVHIRICSKRDSTFATEVCYDIGYWSIYCMHVQRCPNEGKCSAWNLCPTGHHRVSFDSTQRTGSHIDYEHNTYATSHTSTQAKSAQRQLRGAKQEFVFLPHQTSSNN